MKKITNFALNPDNQTKIQFEHCIKEDFVIAASLMPDAHSGYVAPIGSVFLVENYLVPSWVGYDIGCGMIACRFFGVPNLVEKAISNSSKIYELVSSKVPMGEGNYNHIQNVSKETKEEFKSLLNKFKQGEYDSEIFNFLKNKSLSHLGTLGGGNHFMELLIDDSKEELWVVVHSGSRGVGHKVAQKYMKKASGSEKRFEETFPIKDDSKEGKEYINILDFGLNFALLNRLEMAYKVRDVLKEIIGQQIDFELWTNKNHNHAIREENLEFNGNRIYIHRKGATPAKKGERGVIPANMRDGCFLVEGLGNKDFLESSSHGAGRILSRGEAKRQITLEQFKKSMVGIVGTINDKTIDESPFAYKNIYDVMEKQKESVRVIKHLKPIINWKG